MKLRYCTAGESHGKSLTGILDGIPAGLAVAKEEVDSELARRQQGYGRGDRMKIEKDRVDFLSGIRNGITLGSPVTVSIDNKDWVNWVEIMSPYPQEHKAGMKEVKNPRPGHADLTGGIKYNTRDLRNILERASARETAVRVAIGAICKIFLKTFDIRLRSRVLEIGGVAAKDIPADTDTTAIDASPLRTTDKDAELLMIKRIDQAKKDGESLGGVFEVTVSNLPVGLGSHTQWDRKLDAGLGMALLSIQAIKGVEIGLGFEAARRQGSEVHDEIIYDNASFRRRTNNAGGIEGGMSNGEDIVIKAAMKPIATLYTPLRTVNIDSKKEVEASVERSDICAVPAASIVGEAVTAIEIASHFLEKFGGDSMTEIKSNYHRYLNQVKDY